MVARLLAVAGLLPVIVFGGLFSVSCSETEPMISWEEFYAEFVNRESKLPELKSVHSYFREPDTSLSRAEYSDLLKESFAHLDGYFEDLQDHPQLQNLKKEIDEDIDEFVNLGLHQADFTIKDFYLDLFGGRLNSWLQAYAYSPDGLKPPRQAQSFASIETGVDL
jgi:hypothetical protein